MFKLKLAGAAAAVMLVGLVTAGSAFAQTYEDPTINIQLDDVTPVEGSTLEVNASAEVDCAWSISFNGLVETDAGNTASASFEVPEVDERTVFPLVVRCVYDDGQPTATPSTETPQVIAPLASSTAVTPAAIQTVTRTVDVTVLPRGDDGLDDDAANEDGVLPDTGGSNAQLLIIGGVLVATGVGVTVAARRRGARA